MKKIAYSTQLIEEDDINSVISVLKSSHLTQGSKVEKFEESLCSYTGAKYAVTFNSATSALLAAYTIAGLQKGDEVITTPISFVATSNMLIEVGAKPIWCDVKLDGNIDEELIEGLITTKTKAIVPVHFAGKAVELKKIHKIAKRHKLLVIEDAAHALGSTIDGMKIGALSDMTIFSFHAIKPITTAEGGAILTNNKEYARKLQLFRSHGIVKKQFWDSDMISSGYNFRMSEIAAALGISQMRKLDNFLHTRNEIASYYDQRFKNEKLFSILPIPINLTSSRHLYPIKLNKKIEYFKENIFKLLHEKGIGVQVHYKPIYQNSFYIEKFGKISLVNSDDFYHSELSIPCHHKMSLNEADYIVNTLLNILSQYDGENNS